MLKELLALLLALGPAPSLSEAQAEAVAPLPAEAVNPIEIEVPLSGTATGTNGTVYRIEGTFKGRITAELPEPAGPTITALKNEEGQVVSAIRSGELLSVEGVGLMKAGVPLRVQIPGRSAALVSATTTLLKVRFPAVTAPQEGKIQIWWNEGSGWVLKATNGLLSVIPVSPVPGGPPRIQGYKGPGGVNKRTFLPGESITLTGEGFGTTPGRVLLSGWPAPVLQWSEREVMVAGYPWATVGQPAWETLWVQVWTAEGLWADTFSREYDPVVTR